jgi:signal transduction histidine kinase
VQAFIDKPSLWAEVVHPDDRLISDNIYEKLQKIGSAVRECRIVRPDGSIAWVQDKSKFIYDEQGNPLRVEGITSDITERKQAEETLREANKKLNLLSSITRHDINNQLTVLQGYLTILKKKHPGLSGNEYFEKTAISTQRIASIIQFTKEYENIGVNAPVWQDCRNLVDIAVKQATLGQVTVQNDLPAGTEVFADPLIARVFYNLLDNAVRHGGKITAIRFSAEERDGILIVLCEDDGIGVPAEDKERIFERGFGKNTGLGLFLSREILAITGITTTENGVPGKGARFEMTVPKKGFRFTGK